MILPWLLALVALVALSAAFSMAEAAFLAVNKVRLRHLMNRGSPSARLVYQLLTRMDRLIATLVVSDNLVDVALAAMGTVLFVSWLGMSRGPLVATLVVSALLLVFGDITPKIFGAGHADRIALLLARPMQWLIRFMRPLVALFEVLSHGLIGVLGGKRLQRSPLVTEEEVKVMIEMGREAGAVTDQELRMLHRIFEFEDTLVRDVMIPREQIAGVEITQAPETILDVLIEEGHSRVPVYRGSLDRIEGIIYTRDLLAVWRHGGLFVLPDLIRPAYLVPETKRVAELLRDFQRLKIQIAIVQDDAHATLGLVTLENLLEEIVGQIHEEIPLRPAGPSQGQG
jgi:CBS domain containing-hemolysin-like protein